MRNILLIFFSCMVSAVSGQDTLTVADLSHGWMGLTKSGELTPVFNPEDQKVIIFKVPPDLPDHYLLLSTEKPVDIWLNDKLLYHEFDSIVLLKANTFSQNDQLKVYASRGIPAGFVSRVVTLHQTEKSQDLLKERKADFETERYLVLGTILLLLAGFFRKYFPITFNQSFRNPLSYKIRSISVDQTYVSFGSVDNLYSAFFFGGLIGFLLIYLDYDFMLVSGDIFINSLVNWLLVSLVVSMAIMVKFFLAKTLAALYQIRELPNIQTQDFTHFFTLVATGAALITFLDFSFFDSTSDFFKEVIHYLLVASVIFFQFWLFFKFDRFYAVRKLMIISYLCTTEFLPGFLTVYWLMKM